MLSVTLAILLTFSTTPIDGEGECSFLIAPPKFGVAPAPPEWEPHQQAKRLDDGGAVLGAHLAHVVECRLQFLETGYPGMCQAALDVQGAACREDLIDLDKTLRAVVEGDSAIDGWPIWVTAVVGVVSASVGALVGIGIAEVLE